METVLKEVFRDGIEVGEKGIIAQIEATPGNA
jgi:hypothetical protein